jgi:hypothetical protein
MAIATNEVMKDRRKPKATNQPKDYGWPLYLMVITLIMIAGYLVSFDNLYKSGDDIGYNLGLAGGLMMLSLLIYPLRKRIPMLRNMGLLPVWFKWHMVFGILGPALIMFHSTFSFYIPFIHPQGSMNAAVAMYCMLLVSGSGTFGRFFYTKIHHGLYGRQASLNEMRNEMEETENVKSMFHFAPAVEKAMEEFHNRGVRMSQETGYGFGNFIKVGFEASSLARTLSKQIHEIMHTQAREQHFNAQQIEGMEKLYKEYREKIIVYLRAVRDAAQFHTYERLFSWWHVFHIPLVYMMVFSAFYHVYAVHAY